jgi:hypothetical protein
MTVSKDSSLRLSMPMRKPWTDPVKSRPAKESTLNTKGNFREFTDLMRKIVVKKPASHGPAAS